MIRQAKTAWLSKAFVAALLVLPLGLAGSGCGGGEEPTEGETITCGAGTVLADGQCVLAEFDCPEGEVPTPVGTCAPPSIFCGPGASYDVELDSCVSQAEITCGEGTVEVESRCVVEGAKVCTAGTVLADGVCRIAANVCGPGTEFEESQCQVSESACTGRLEYDVILGECVDVQAVVCGEDTVEVNNRCLPMATFADELAAQADSDFSLSAAINPGTEPGDRHVFTGTMMSTTLFHVFNLDAQAGQWLKITLYSRGLPSPGFRVRQPFGGWDRRAPAGLSNAPSRTVLVPSTGTLDLIVETSVSGTSGAVGSADWQYVGVVEVLEAPVAESWDLFADNLELQIGETKENFVQVALPTGRQTLIVADEMGEDIQGGVLEYWTSPTTLASRFDLRAGSILTVEHDAAGLAYFLFDALSIEGPRRTATVEAFETTTLLAGTTYQETIEVQQGEVLFFAHRSSAQSTLRGRVVGPQGGLLFDANVLANNRTTYNVNDADRGFLYAQETGTYTVQLENTGNNDAEGFFASLSTRIPPTLSTSTNLEEIATLEESFSTDGLSQGRWTYLLIDAATAARVEGAASVATGRPDVSVYDVDGTRVENFTNTGTTQSFAFNLWEGGPRILAVRPFNSLGGGLTVELTGQPLEVLEPGEALEFPFTASTFDVLTGTAGFFDGAVPTLRLLNPVGEAVFTRDLAESEVEFLELLPATGGYLLELRNDTEDPVIGAFLGAEVGDPAEVVIFNADQVEAQVSQGALQEGERQLFLVRSFIDLFLQVTATLGEDESLAMEMRNFETGERVMQGSGVGEVALAAPAFEAGIYVLVVEALTDVASYTLDFGGSEIFLVEGSYYHDPALFIEPTGDDTGQETSTIEITGCPFVAEVKVTLDFNSGLKSFMYWDLTAPNGTTVRLNDRSSGAVTNPIVYPVTMQPDEPLEAFLGGTGSGTWTLTLDNQASFTDAYFSGWELDLVCGGN